MNFGGWWGTSQPLKNLMSDFCICKIIEKLDRRFKTRTSGPPLDTPLRMTAKEEPLIQSPSHIMLRSAI